VTDNPIEKAFLTIETDCIDAGPSPPRARPQMSSLALDARCLTHRSVKAFIDLLGRVHTDSLNLHRWRTASNSPTPCSNPETAVSIWAILARGQ
jgi:hypothetical protein